MDENQNLIQENPVVQGQENQHVPIHGIENQAPIASTSYVFTQGHLPVYRAPPTSQPVVFRDLQNAKREYEEVKKREAHPECIEEAYKRCRVVKSFYAIPGENGIAGILAEVQSVGTRVGHLSTLMGQMNGRLDQMNGRIDQMNGRIDQMTDQMNGRIDQMNEGIDQLSTRVLGLSDNLASVRRQQIRLGNRTGEPVRLPSKIIGGGNVQFPMDQGPRPFDNHGAAAIGTIPRWPADFDINDRMNLDVCTRRLSKQHIEWYRNFYGEDFGIQPNESLYLMRSKFALWLKVDE
jgi:hypothetical protein